ncbi:hypothetical protein [Borrelia anserina]|uniref:hypothetical protein n=1 Tax=Borrelia anserina TaxID=143 RepID=UPI001E5F2937|nr:hypothetical protein [Borrelia anserina]
MKLLIVSYITRLGIMFLNFILMLTFVIFSCSDSVLASEEIEILHNVNDGTVCVKMVLNNKSGLVHVSYPYRHEKDNGRHIIFDFDILTGKPLNLLKVAFNGIPVEHKYLRSSYDGKQLELNYKQYFLPFDDSIDKTGFLIHLNTELGEHLGLLEVARNEGLRFDVECVERDSGVKRNISFSFSIDSAQKFFDIVDKFRAY